MVFNEDSHSAREPSEKHKKKNGRRTVAAMTLGALALGLLTGGILAYQSDG